MSTLPLAASTTLTLEARPAASKATATFLLIGVVVVVTAFFVSATARGPMLATAIFPLAAAAACWLTRPKPFRAELTETALIVHEPRPLEVHYAAFQAIQPEAMKGHRFPIHVLHQGGGVVNVPAEVNPAANHLLPVLVSRLPDLHQLLPADLVAIYRKHVATFGPERVYAFPSRQKPVKGLRGRRGVALALATIFSGAAWIFLGVVSVGKNDPAMWVGLGALFAFFGLLLLIISMSKRELFGGRSPASTGLVISPIGMALIQGDLRGEMKWAELLRLRYLDRPQFLSVHPSPSKTRIDMVLQGARVFINDLYSHPLAHIHEVIKRYWK